ncbi:DUF3124 domain-containing protein [Halodesulfovibrio spirochaetisodalis]|uniref:DUF3124 domain-containing protein n=1 Tax=Halodesulfovibrio spirochaetisodalis TaxID=1560234 RepID=A0A1B7XES8_9BACT|nr:DUF3124 domain-containing protein [Halodesulfovibrio spirochaetisodalis]OBQ52684.1 hypothetical protein SP90_06860 [Halodesulfovibrio spirochaetisodalis]
MRMNRATVFICLLFFAACMLLPPDASARTRLNGQTLYAPAYSYIYHGNREATINLTTTLSVRNTSRKETIRITSVEYYNTEGKLLRSYLDKPVVMAPLQSIRYIVSLNDDEGGSGANFIVKWEADKAVDVPIVESIMLGTGSSYGFAFLTQAVPIE